MGKVAVIQGDKIDASCASWRKKIDTTSIQIKLKMLFSLYFVYVKCDLNENVGGEIPPWSQLFPSTGRCTHVCVQQTQGATHTYPHVEARRFRPL